MMPGRLQQIEALFSRVVDLDPVQRARILDEACGSDLELRREIESLLEHAELPEQFLSDPVLGSDFTLGRAVGPDDDVAGSIIGSYQVRYRLASGGMGTVWLATRADGQFEQSVAIKLVKRGMDSEEILHRFVQERRTLAALNHPRIGRLLDGGATSDGRPYLVMEYVRGLPITRYCDEHRLTVTERLKLFCAVCDAVRFAHQKLVVHRDLKPSNVMVDEAGEPKLLDFGIAKLLVGASSAEVTTVAERRFTPEYASPEQVAGHPLSTATDIYSLGVLLHELLTGQRPYDFETRTLAEFERVVCTQEPLAPSVCIERAERRLGTESDVQDSRLLRAAEVREGTLQRLRRRLMGDVDNIVLKAMHKDSNRRYASVDQFVADIERHLTGLPVLARPDTVLYRAQKFARRNAVSLTFAAFAISVLLGGSGVAVWQARSARQQRDAAYLARDQAEATAAFLQRMLESPDPTKEGPDARVGTVLDEAATLVEAELRDRPLVQAAIRSTIGRTYLALGQMQQAEKLIRSAFQTRSRLLEPGHHDIAESEIDLAHLLYRQGDHAEAERYLRLALATHRRLRGEDNLDTARVWNDLGQVCMAAGKLDDAESAYRRAMEIREKLSGRESLGVAESLVHYAEVLTAKGDLTGAEKAQSRAVEIRRRLLRPDHPLIIESTNDLSSIAATGAESQPANPD